MMASGIEAIRIFSFYVLPGTLGAGSVVMFVMLMARITRIEARIKRADEMLAAKSEELSKSVASVKKEMETDRQDTVQTVAAVAGSTATTRAKALKMHRLGHSAEQISTALRVPKGEVTLLLKVHSIVLRPFEQEGGEQSKVEFLEQIV
jgi:hypothetical protein